MKIPFVFSKLSINGTSLYTVLVKIDPMTGCRNYLDSMTRCTNKFGLRRERVGGVKHLIS